MIFKYLFIFAVFSMIGWVLEVCYRSYMTKNIVNPGFMTGCVIPLYGLGALILTILCEFLPEPNSLVNVIIIFLVSALSLTGLELFSGYTNLKFYNLRLWDYSYRKLNYKGFICLRFTIIWGLLAILFRIAIYPSLDIVVNNFINSDTGLFFLGMFTGIFIIDLCASIDLSRKVNKYANSIKKSINLENLRLDLKLQSKTKNIVNSFYPYINTNSYLKEKIKENKNKKD